MHTWQIPMIIFTINETYISLIAMIIPVCMAPHFQFISPHTIHKYGMLVSSIFNYLSNGPVRLGKISPWILENWAHKSSWLALSVCRSEFIHNSKNNSNEKWDLHIHSSSIKNTSKFSFQIPLAKMNEQHCLGSSKLMPKSPWIMRKSTLWP